LRRAEVEMALSETEEGWRRFIRGLKERGLSGVELAASDAHEGLKQALQEAFPGLIWQRCQSHFRRNVLDQTPSDYRDQMHEVLDQILEASSQKEARTRLDDIREQLEEKASSALETLEDGFYEATAEKYRKRLRTTNMLERFIGRSGGERRWSESSQIWTPLNGLSVRSMQRRMRTGIWDSLGQPVAGT
jgi:transposase-like protein